MTFRTAFPAAICLIGAAALLPAQERGLHGPAPSRNLPAGASPKRYQEVTVAHRSVCRVQGLETRSDLRYVVLSSMAVDERDDGSLAVEQKVEAARLLQADAVAEPLFTALLEKLAGTTFALRFNPHRELVRFEGANEEVRAAGGAGFGEALLLASLIDRDGWKELAQLSFFRPPRPLRPGARWERTMTHSWGGLGSWTGQARFALAGKQGNLQRFPYTLKLSYLPPKGPAGGLPLRIVDPIFKHDEAGGTIYFDPGEGRVRRIEERFQVKGKMSITLLGQNIPVELDEDQAFLVRLLDLDPRTK